jgi:hypothetical protein
MIEHLVLPATTTHGGPGRRLDDPPALFRGLIVAIGLSVPMWGGLIWSLTKVA